MHLFYIYATQKVFNKPIILIYCSFCTYYDVQRQFGNDKIGRISVRKGKFVTYMLNIRLYKNRSYC